MDDATTHGTGTQNAELVAATWADSLLDAPIWLFNKATGAAVPAPLHLGADVYASQTEGDWVDVEGHVLTKEEVAAAAADAESRGAVIDAARKTGDDLVQNPFAIIPPWAWVVLGLAGAAATAFGVAYVVRAFK